VAWLAGIPAGPVAVLAYWAHRGNWKAPFDAQRFWDRSFAPLGGALHGTWDAAVGFAQVAVGPGHHVLATPLPQQNGILSVPTTLATIDLTDFAFFAFAVVACVGAARRLPLAYVAYALAALALPLSYPVGPQPLMSLPRFELVLVGLWMWWGRWLSRHPRARVPALALSAAGLVAFTAQFATWRFVA
jgi:hypothetical protein